MKLLGRFLSPYTRIVALCLRHYGIAHEQRQLAIVNDEHRQEIESHNSLVRVPVLVLDNGTSIVESEVILKYIESIHNGPSLFADSHGNDAQLLALYGRAKGIMDRAVAAFYESSRRPEEFRWNEQLEKLDRDWCACLSDLEAGAPEEGLFGGNQPNIMDYATVVVLDFLKITRPTHLAQVSIPKLNNIYVQMSEHQHVIETRPA
jgi:glutathione S-transferase